jgi:predicted secreted protein
MAGILGSAHLSGAVLGTIGKIVSVSGPKMAQEMIDVTDSDSPDNMREKIHGFIDPGQYTVECNYNDDIYHTLHEAVKAETNDDTFTVTYSDGSTEVGPATLSDLSTGGSVGDKRTFTFTLFCTGGWTHTAAA